MANSIAISSGHALYVRGASDIIDEVTEARRVTDKTAEYLRQLGVTTYVFHDNTSRTQNQNLSTIVSFHNSKNRELDVSIHFNSSGHTNNPLGVEVLYYNQSDLAAKVSQAIANASGLKNRGAKQQKELYFLRNTKKPAILIEVCFVNSTVDVDLYRKNFDDICRAIAETLSGKKVSQPVPQSQQPTTPSSGNIGIGSIVTVAAHATHYQTGQPIASFVRGKSYKVIQVKNVNQSNSKKAYLLDGIMSWVLEQDIVESGIGNGSPTPQPTPNNLYRVRKSWSDVGSQIGAYGDLNNAIETAKANAGYKVYDSNGNQVYPTASQPTPTPTNLYRVRKTWDDSKSQIGAFKDLNNAKELADSRADEGYKVFDDNGKVVYTPSKPQPKEETVIHTVVKGDTLWSISQKYSITVDDIKNKNGLKDNTIFVGQKLVIKGTAPEQEEPKKEESKEQESEKPKDEPKEEPKVDEHKGHNNIIGKSVVSAEKMSAFVKSKNPNAQDIDEIAKAFIEVGERYGIRGDIAFCQSIIETGWFKFDDGTAVTPDQHNYCGLGVTSKGIKGHSFPTVKDGVTAQIQHLFAYATKDNLPEGEEIIDPRFKYVSRGVAPHWEDLNMKWAMNDNYGQHIISIYDQLNKFEYSLPAEEPEEEKETNPSDDLHKEDNKDEQDLEKEKQFKFWTRVIDYLIDKLAKLFGIKKK